MTPDTPPSWSFRYLGAPVIALFERKEFVVTIDATQSKDDVYADICDRLGLRRQE